MLKYGKDSIRSRAQPLKEICRDLHCQRDRYTWTSHPALEGTSCAESKVKNGTKKKKKFQLFDTNHIISS